MDLYEMSMQYLKQAKDARQLAGLRREQMRRSIGKERKRLQMQVNDLYQIARECEDTCIHLQSIHNHGRRRNDG